ncbi:MAG: acylase [Actinobacteria bacterium]|nr:MAG: acylase [Actinomycetota bacterium]
MVLAAACSPGEGPASIPLPTSADTTSTTTTTTTTTTIPPTTLVPPKYEATIRRTTDGVPHIIADDLASVAYGQGWVSNEDHGCTLADQVLKIYSERAATLGPGGDGENIESDFAWKAIDIVGIATDDFENASDEVVDQFNSFTAGWNAYLTDVGSEGMTGWCSGNDWIQPLEPVEVYAYARSVALLASSSRMANFIPGAQPPEPEPEIEGFASGEEPTPERPVVFPELAPPDFGSNGWAIGSKRTEGGTGGLLVANPHFPWEGELRFAEVQLTVPGEIDIYGAQLLGLPGIGIGFTEGAAWTHTVSAGKRMTGYMLTLDPASPTSYMVDGESRPMTSGEYTIEILRADETVDTETRTLWRSEYGPIIDFPGIGWTETNAITFRDANIDNNEFVEQYARMIEVESIDDLIELNSEYQGVPLFNTIATGADGRVWYADAAATPNLSDEAELAYLNRLFTDPITLAASDQGFVLLDGSTSLYDWEEVPGARDPGLIPFEELPMVVRNDYVFNANDSFWVPSAEFTITGDYSVLIGTQNTPLSMRSRQNAAVLGADNTAGLAGDDGNFTGLELRDAVFENTGQSAVLLRAAAVRACRTTPVVDVTEILADDGTVSLAAESVDLAEACNVLSDWDDVYDLDRSGPMVWRETVSQFGLSAFKNAGPLFGDPFDPADPTRTPAVPSADETPILQAMARSVQTITKAGFALDSTLGAAQFTQRADERIPLHGGTGADGVTNIVTWSANSSSSEPVPTRGEVVAEGSPLRGEGYRINYGTSFVMTVDYSGESVQAWALLTYGETGDRESPLFESQTVRFSEKNWRDVAFTNEQIEADPKFAEQTISGN